MSVKVTVLRALTADDQHMCVTTRTYAIDSPECLHGGLDLVSNSSKAAVLVRGDCLWLGLRLLVRHNQIMKLVNGENGRFEIVDFHSTPCAVEKKNSFVYLHLLQDQ